jgi:hypothetical protein
MRASGAPSCTSSVTVVTACCRVGKGTMPLPTISGRPCRRSVASVMMPSVPSAPQNRRTKS